MLAHRTRRKPGSMFLQTYRKASLCHADICFATTWASDLIYCATLLRDKGENLSLLQTKYESFFSVTNSDKSNGFQKKSLDFVFKFFNQNVLNAFAITIPS